MTEAQGCEVLRGCFEAAGFKIVENYELSERGQALRIDGFDPTRRVGYEYVSLRDRQQRETLGALEDRNSRGDFKVLLVEDGDFTSADDLAWVASRFLDRVRQ